MAWPSENYRTRIRDQHSRNTAQRFTPPKLSLSEVAPHGYAHEHLGKISVADAQTSVQRTFDTFTREVPGFDPRQSLYHLPYLAAPAPVVQWIGERTLGARMALGNAGRNDPATWSRGRPVDCLTFGPPNAQSRARERIARFVHDEDGWLVLVLHGLDGERWGTVASTALEQMLDEVLSAGVAVTTPNRFLMSRKEGSRQDRQEEF